MKNDQPPKKLLTAAQEKMLRSALDALDELAASVGERWDDYDFDDLSSARSTIRQWEGWTS